MISIVVGVVAVLAGVLQVAIAIGMLFFGGDFWTGMRFAGQALICFAAGGYLLHREFA